MNNDKYPLVGRHDKLVPDVSHILCKKLFCKMDKVLLDTYHMFKQLFSIRFLKFKPLEIMEILHIYFHGMNKTFLTEIDLPYIGHN